MYYFYATASVTQQSDNIYNTGYVTVIRSHQFTLDHYPSRKEVEALFDHTYVTNIDITSVAAWTQEQYEAW